MACVPEIREPGLFPGAACRLGCEAVDDGSGVVVMPRRLPTRAVLSTLVALALLCSAIDAQRQAAKNDARDTQRQDECKQSHNLNTDIQVGYAEPLFLVI